MEPRMLLRSLKGAPLSVLAALFMVGPGSRQDLINWTGWEKGALDKGLRLLEDYALVIRPSYKKWALSDGAKQLPLFNYPLNGQLGCGKTVDNPSNYPLNGQLVTSSSSRSNKLTREEVTQPNQDILEACAELGIFGRKREKLARLDHVVAGGADYVRGHVAAAESVGLAIWRMEEGWDVPGERPLDDDQVPERYRDIVKR